VVSKVWVFFSLRKLPVRLMLCFTAVTKVLCVALQMVGGEADQMTYLLEAAFMSLLSLVLRPGDYEFKVAHQTVLLLIFGCKRLKT